MLVKKTRKKESVDVCKRMKKRDHQANGLECLSTIVSLCRRELILPHVTSDRSTRFELEAENIRLQTILHQRECECTEHEATIAQLRGIRSKLEQQLTEAMQEPVPLLCRYTFPEIPLTPEGRDAGQWHMLARSLQMQLHTYRRMIDDKNEQISRMQAAHQKLKTALSSRDKESSQAVGVSVICSSSAAP
jgi:hypothetical protein